MLNYEKALHFDKRYEKLQNTHWNITLISLVWSTLIYCIIYYGLKMIGCTLGNLYSWKSSKELFSFYQLHILKADVLYFLGGLFLVYLGIYRTMAISKENHSVQKNGIPTELLITGYYSRLRHPMYGAFILVYSGIFLSTRSVYGMLILLIFIVIQYLNAFLEEKKLRSFFPNEYLLYCKRTTHKLMTNLQIILLAFIFFITMIGLFY